ncbi:MAG: 50S ribosomal protein L20 [Candidatus Aminicenantia bacterium]
MPRVKRGPRRKEKRKKILKLAKGYRGMKSKNYRIAKEAVEKSLLYSYADRRKRKRDFRRLWIIRINSAVRSFGLTYNKFMAGLKALNIKLDRKILADMAFRNDPAFSEIADKVLKATSSNS